ncbi:hypothetical protein [Lewinella sp. LCG006]|uniref:hypothetical protein n=1 Tax=Lewinella sp. LCG006 TaxID=3231911 RepID=UPI0034606214
MVGFYPKRVIDNPEELFGRELLLQQLIRHVTRNNIVQVIGLRRYGKTSLLKCLETIIKKEVSDRVIPFYIDFKEEGSMIKGTSNVYRYLIARVVEKLAYEKLFCSDIDIRGVALSPVDDWLDCYDYLQEHKDVRILTVFKEVIYFFSELSGKTIYFLFDEYEYLFRHVFDEPVGFMAMRTLSAHHLPNGQSPFGFIVSGAYTFEHLCTITGSGELNVISDTVYVPPLTKEAFTEMWEFECKRVDTGTLDLADEMSFLYEASGGVPFYAKVIGEQWVVRQERPTYLNLSSYFEEIYPSLSIEEHSVIKSLSYEKKQKENSYHVGLLQRKGLVVREDDGLCRLFSKFFNQYLESKRKQTAPYQVDHQNVSERVKKITKLITIINNTSDNRAGMYVFNPTNDDGLLFDDLRALCSTDALFADFASSLYKIIFERTKDSHGGNLKTLPTAFQRKNRFVKVVDILRHSLGGGHLMDSFQARSGQLSKADMLKLLTGKKNDPSSTEDFIYLQIKVLDLFEQYLIELKQEVEK